MDPSNKAYWFRAKRYGWGWGLPLRWQGWAVLLAYFVLQFGALGLMMPANVPGFLAVTGVLIALLILVCWRTGEPPRWRRGGER